VATNASSPVVTGAPAVRADLDAALAALLATGATMPDALGHLAQAFPPEAVAKAAGPWLRQEAQCNNGRGRPYATSDLGEGLRLLAATAGIDLAQRALLGLTNLKVAGNFALEGQVRNGQGQAESSEVRTLAALPEGLEVEGILYLRELPNLTALPRGLRTDHLQIQGCPSLVQVPADLADGVVKVHIGIQNGDEVAEVRGPILAVLGSGYPSGRVSISGGPDILTCLLAEALTGKSSRDHYGA
jgi:hypothetical protein